MKFFSAMLTVAMAPGSEADVPETVGGEGDPRPEVTSTAASASRSAQVTAVTTTPASTPTLAPLLKRCCMRRISKPPQKSHSLHHHHYDVGGEYDTYGYYYDSSNGMLTVNNRTMHYSSFKVQDCSDERTGELDERAFQIVSWFQMMDYDTGGLPPWSDTHCVEDEEWLWEVDES